MRLGWQDKPKSTPWKTLILLRTWAFHSACYIIVELWLFEASPKPHTALWSDKSYALRTEKSPIFCTQPKDTNVENFTECFEWKQLLVAWTTCPEQSFCKSLYYHPASHTQFAADWGFLSKTTLNVLSVSSCLSSQMLTCLPSLFSNNSSTVQPF